MGCTPPAGGRGGGKGVGHAFTTGKGWRGDVRRHGFREIAVPFRRYRRQESSAGPATPLRGTVESVEPDSTFSTFPPRGPRDAPVAGRWGSPRRADFLIQPHPHSAARRPLGPPSRQVSRGSSRHPIALAHLAHVRAPDKAARVGTIMRGPLDGVAGTTSCPTACGVHHSTHFSTKRPKWFWPAPTTT